jgi:hypothetical protein
MDYSDSELLLEFAKDAFSRVSLIAADLGASKKNCLAGCLAAQLWIAQRSLAFPGPKQLEFFHKRGPKLLGDLERVCMVLETLFTCSGPLLTLFQ